MHHKHNIVAARVAGGINPSPVTLCTAQYTDDWDSELVSLIFTQVELVNTEGDLAKLRNHLAELIPSKEEDPTIHRARRHIRPVTNELVIDCTADPQFSSMMDAESYSIRTGDRIDDTSGQDMSIGRLVLLSNLKTLLARKLLKFSPQDGWPDVQGALVAATSKPPAIEPDGLLVTDAGSNDDLVLTVALACWRAVYHSPGGQDEELDYSAQLKSVI